MMRSRAYFVATALILVVLLSGCVQKEDDRSNTTMQGEVKVGVMQSLTGDLGSYGGAMTDAMKLAAKQVNANGGVLG